MKEELLIANLKNKSTSDFLKTSYQKLSNPKLNEREHVDKTANERNRNPYHRDYTRILYSSSFRRLQGKMQILGIQSDAFFRNRLTHSLEVSQIARFIAEQIGLVVGDKAYTNINDLYVIEAAALAHDIGHPAFGHCGERVLDKLSECNRFEGNAQNYRVLRSLEKKIPEHTGLNLTFRTLLSINKYLVKEDAYAGVEKFLYIEDYEILSAKRKEVGLISERTLDVQIIDVADEIAYAVHDLEDALSIGYFDINELTYLLEKRLKNKSNSFGKFVKCVEKAKESAKAINSHKTIQEFSQIFRKELVSTLTNVLIRDIGVVRIDKKSNVEHGTNTKEELGFCNYKDLAHGLKKITFECINRSDNIALYEQRGKVVIEGLYQMFTDTDYNKNYSLLPPDYRPKTEENLHRVVIDYIAGMMDTFAISLYEKHFGVSFDNIKYRGK